MPRAGTAPGSQSSQRRAAQSDAASSRPSAARNCRRVYAQPACTSAVPVVVVPRRKSAGVGRVVELGPGSIIQFEKSCEDMLDLSVGNRVVASGEAVKVGDKFGLRQSLDHLARGTLPADPTGGQWADATLGRLAGSRFMGYTGCGLSAVFPPCRPHDSVDRQLRLVHL